MTPTHRYERCLTRGNGLECWRCALRFLVWVSVFGEKALEALNLALFLKVPNFSALGAFSPDTLTQIKIRVYSANILFSMLFLHNRQGMSENSNCTYLVGADSVPIQISKFRSDHTEPSFRTAISKFGNPI